MKMKTSIAPNFSEGRAQKRSPSLSNSKKDSREIGMVVIRELRHRGARAEKPDRSLVLIRGTISLFVLFDRRYFTESVKKRRLDK